MYDVCRAILKRELPTGKIIGKGKHIFTNFRHSKGIINNKKAKKATRMTRKSECRRADVMINPG